MKNDEILTKAIAKARLNGWDMWGWRNFQVVMGGVGFFDGYGDFVRNAGKGNLDSDFDVIFNHEFAKAFFGEEDIEIRYDSDYQPISKVINNVGWQKHLQAMVLEENPIKYLEPFVQEE